VKCDGGCLKTGVVWTFDGTQGKPTAGNLPCRVAVWSMYNQPVCRDPQGGREKFSGLKKIRNCNIRAHIYFTVAKN
jgi:hypothetical protein